MTDIPGILASEFDDDARSVPGQEAFTNRKNATEEGQTAEAIANSEHDDARPIFYKEDPVDFTDTAEEAREAAVAADGSSADESTYGAADL
ncbi:hypothetical protein [Subtercola lobariae]|uniref:Uncharacterized protein n=1 Tax=Subtercola lobariae TaxID=1588641 RepID=A0A917B1Q0_9MICO|nr:hypothetical protein [Subtercola lobariae]GGF12126.1 hypothetical protein GCM10011399_02550 [Subtercola lobariae]